MTSALSSRQFLEHLQLVLSQIQCDTPASFDLGSNSKVLLCGNGGSAAVAIHVANDLVKQGKSAFALTDPSVMSCLANDEGWERVYADQVLAHAKQTDTVVAISSSGKSLNILQAVYAAKERGARTITLSGFEAMNPLRQMGDHNYYVPSFNYGIVEVAHLAILHSLSKPI